MSRRPLLCRTVSEYTEHAAYDKMSLMCERRVHQAPGPGSLRYCFLDISSNDDIIFKLNTTRANYKKDARTGVGCWILSFRHGKTAAVAS